MTNLTNGIPYVDLVAQNRLIIDDAIGRIRRVFEHGQFILGPEVSEIEDKLADYLGVKHVIGVNSGTDALVLALRAHGIKDGDEVITVSHTFLATAAAICMVGAVPVFADVDRETMLLSTREVEAQITPKTRAIIPVHLNGYPCDMEALSALAEARGLVLIEDAAQALGARYSGRSVGTWGTGCFSLHPLKVLSACGDGGFIATNCPDLAKTVRKMRNIGLENRDEAALVSGNSRLDTVQAAFLLAKFPYLDKWIEERNQKASEYRVALAGKVMLPPEEAGVRCVYSAFVIRIVGNRNRILKALVKEGVDVKVHYPIPVHQQKPYRKFVRSPLPVTEQVVNSILSLPCTPELTSPQQNIVIDRILNLLDE